MRRKRVRRSYRVGATRGFAHGIVNPAAVVVASFAGTAIKILRLERDRDHRIKAQLGGRLAVLRGELEDIALGIPLALQHDPLAGEGFREMLAVALREIQTSRRIFDELKEKATSSPMRVMAEIVVADQALWEVAELGRVLVEAAAGPDSAARGHRLGRLIHFAAESLGRAHDAMPKVDRGWGGEDRTFEEVLTEAMEPLNKLMDAEIPGTLAAGK